MYDQREKALRDHQWMLRSALKEGLEQGREQGREEGWEQGVVVGSIRMLQELLGEEVSSLETLCELPLLELSTKLADLQQKLRTRGG